MKTVAGVRDLKNKLSHYYESLSGHPKPANEGHLKTGQR